MTITVSEAGRRGAVSRLANYLTTEQTQVEMRRRKALGQTQARIAALAGVTLHAANHWATGKTRAPKSILTLEEK